MFPNYSPGLFAYRVNQTITLPAKLHGWSQRHIPKHTFVYFERDKTGMWWAWLINEKATAFKNRERCKVGKQTGDNLDIRLELCEFMCNLDAVPKDKWRACELRLVMSVENNCSLSYEEMIEALLAGAEAVGTYESPRFDRHRFVDLALFSARRDRVPDDEDDAG